MSKGLTMTIIFQAGSLNYGEGIGNISELKKLNRGNGITYTFASRQCIDFDIVRLGKQLFGWNLDTVCKNGTIQYKKEATIKDSEEMDLFGYMKTASKAAASTRSAVVRVSHAISLEPYKSDMDFLTNKGMADRINENPNLANIEQHESFYTYTVTIDLDKVGVDGDIVLDNKEKAKRVKQVLEIIKILNRNIRGRQENLSPLFVIGGIYDIPNPFFQGRCELIPNNNGFVLDLAPINSTLKTKLLGKSIVDDTFVGLIDNIFSNTDEIKNNFKDKVLSVQNFFSQLEDKIDKIYE